MTQTLQPYIALMRLNRPIGIFLLLWPTLIALWLASNGQPDLHTTLIFVLGVIIMRSAGCVINDYADRDFDLYVERTKQRPLATQQLSVRTALTLFFGLIGLALILVMQLKIYTMMLSLVAAALAILYPFTKRFSKYPQLFLGLAFAWSIPMVYAQMQSHISQETWVLFMSTVAWVLAYDTQYAMADKVDDLKIGIKSTAITFGKYDKLIIFALQVFSLCGFTSIGLHKGFNLWFYVSLIIALGFAFYQQWLIKDRMPTRCFTAFLNNNYFGAMLFIGTFLGINLN